MTDTSGYMEFVYECVICLGRFTDEELLLAHICPLREGNEYIELAPAPPERYTETAPGARAGLGPLASEQPPETRLGDTAIAIGEDAFRAAWGCCVNWFKDQHGVTVPGNEAIEARERAWSRYSPPEAIKALT